MTRSDVAGMSDNARPRLGIDLPTFGPHAGPAAIATVAQAAEHAGFDCVSATERLLLPATPEWRNDAGLPESYVLDPLEALTWAAAHTRQIRLATGIVNALFQPPIVLARRLATLDQLSDGRLDVGVGQGWLPEEFAAVGVPMARRGRGFEEYLAALRACWGPDPVDYTGRHYRIPRATVGPKPHQSRLPVLIGALAPDAVARAARLGDGFITGVRDWDTSRAEVARYRDAGGAGRVVARVISNWCAGDPVAPVAQFVAVAVEDLERAAAAGVDEVHWGMNNVGVPPERQVEAIDALAQALR